MSKFQNGDKVKDSVTGFEGIIVCTTNWLNGCTRYGVQPDKLTKEGTMHGVEMVDEPQLILVKAAVQPEKMKKVENKPGGPRDACEKARQ